MSAHDDQRERTRAADAAREDEYYRTHDIFGAVRTANPRGHDGDTPRGPLDLTEEEGTVWAEFRYSTKAVIAALLRARKAMRPS